MRDPRTDSAERPLAIESERRRESARGRRLIAVFLLGCAGWVGPLLRVASRDAPPGGWPRPFLFVYIFWILLIALIALALRSRPEE